LLLSLQRVAPFRIEIVDIAGDADLERRFLLEVPVVEVDGAVVSSGQVDLDAVRAAVNHARIAAARRTATGEG
jgi:predicted thioredoxin/glutaredoxin